MTAILVPEVNIWTPPSEWPRWMFDRLMKSVSAFPYGTVAVSGGGTLYDLSDLASNYTDLGAATQQYGVQVVFRTAGDIDVLRDIGSDLNDEQDPYTHDTAECWVRVTYVSGDNIMTGPTLGSWHVCSTQRVYTYRYTSGGGSDERTGVYDFELSSESDGTPIEATKQITLNVGELF